MRCGLPVLRRPECAVGLRGYPRVTGVGCRAAWRSIQLQLQLPPCYCTKRPFSAPVTWVALGTWVTGPSQPHFTALGKRSPRGFPTHVYNGDATEILHWILRSECTVQYHVSAHGKESSAAVHSRRSLQDHTVVCAGAPWTTILLRLSVLCCTQNIYERIVGLYEFPLSTEDCGEIRSDRNNDVFCRDLCSQSGSPSQQSVSAIGPSAPAAQTTHRKNSSCSYRLDCP